MSYPLDIPSPKQRSLFNDPDDHEQSGLSHIRSRPVPTRPNHPYTTRDMQDGDEHV